MNMKYAMRSEDTEQINVVSWANWKGKPTSEVTYFTCLKMLSETLAKMPIKYYQKTDKGIIEAEATDTSKLLSKRPNPFMTPTTFWNTVEINRNHYGNAYVYILCMIAVLYE